MSFNYMLGKKKTYGCFSVHETQSWNVMISNILIMVTIIKLFFFFTGVSHSNKGIVHILWFVVFYKLIPAHNVFVLYISQYLTFALHFVGQGPVSMYNNFIYAIGFSQHFNGFNWIHISVDIYTQYAAFYRCKPMFSATTAHCSIKFAIKMLKPRCFEWPVQFIWVKQVKSPTPTLSPPTTLHTPTALLASLLKASHSSQYSAAAFTLTCIYDLCLQWSWQCQKPPCLSSLSVMCQLACQYCAAEPKSWTVQKEKLSILKLSLCLSTRDKHCSHFHQSESATFMLY